jgi:hypothetical protein
MRLELVYGPEPLLSDCLQRSLECTEFIHFAPRFIETAVLDGIFSADTE